MKRFLFVATTLVLSLSLASCIGTNRGNYGSARNSDKGPVVDTVKVYDTTYVEVKEVERVRSHPRGGEEFVPSILNEYVVTSFGGYGVYMRYRPQESAKTDIIYRDDMHFMGAPSRVPGWIMVVEDDEVIGYMPEEKVYELDGDYYEAQ